MQIATTECQGNHYAFIAAGSDNATEGTYFPEEDAFVDPVFLGTDQIWTTYTPQQDQIVMLSWNCNTIVNDYIAILYLPVFLILIGIIVMITLKIFEFKNPWRT